LPGGGGGSIAVSSHMIDYNAYYCSQTGIQPTECSRHPLVTDRDGLKMGGCHVF